MAERMLTTTATALLTAWAAAPAGVVVEWWGDGTRCRHQGMTIELSKYGKEEMVNPKKGKVPIEICVAEAGSSEGKAVHEKSTRLALEPPQYKSFDATAAVRDWVSGRKPNLGFVVRQLDLWDWWPGKTVLKIRYEGTVKAPRHRSPA